jgi:hypothetical protein
MEAALACGVDRDKLLAALQVIRRGVLRFWKRSVAVGFYNWWRKELKAAHREARAPSMRSLDVGSKALAHAKLMKATGRPLGPQLNWIF